MASKISDARTGETGRNRRSMRHRKVRPVMTEQEVQAYLAARDALRRVRYGSWASAASLRPDGGAGIGREGQAVKGDR